MPEVSDWNAKIVKEFRANGGRIGGNFQGAPLVLVHHQGRKSGREYITPLMYLPDEVNEDVVFVFATRGGDPSNPDWYYNLTRAGVGSIERGTDSYAVTVRDLGGDERDRIYAEQTRRYPGFGEYAKRAEGIRIIPVLELTRGTRGGD
jgi:deazaflavin-dependent oxidoreductase (nitroreductase family)